MTSFKATVWGWLATALALQKATQAGPLGCANFQVTVSLAKFEAHASVGEV